MIIQLTRDEIAKLVRNHYSLPDSIEIEVVDGAVESGDSVPVEPGFSTGFSFDGRELLAPAGVDPHKHSCETHTRRAIQLRLNRDSYALYDNIDQPTQESVTRDQAVHFIKTGEISQECK